jgi:hypothetical protein
MALRAFSKEFWCRPIFRRSTEDKFSVVDDLFPAIHHGEDLKLCSRCELSCEVSLAHEPVQVVGHVKRKYSDLKGSGSDVLTKRPVH